MGKLPVAVEKKKPLGKRGKGPVGVAKGPKVKKKLSTSRSMKKSRSEVDEIIKVGVFVTCEAGVRTSHIHEKQPLIISMNLILVCIK